MQEKMDQWINWVEYDELLEGRHNAPHNLLGLHSFGRGQVFTIYRPEAERVFITDMSGKNELELEEIGESSGFFGKYIPRKNYRSPYKVRVQYSENDIIEYEKDGKIVRERFLSRTMPKVKNYIETKPIDREKYEGHDRKLVGLGKTKRIRKYRMDILGNYYLCNKEEFSKYC